MNNTLFQLSVIRHLNLLNNEFEQIKYLLDWVQKDNQIPIDIQQVVNTYFPNLQKIIIDTEKYRLLL